MSGFVSLTATAPTEALRIWPSVTAAHVSPPSMVFQSPPPTAPKYASFGRPRTPLTAMERPPRSGPIERQRNARSSIVSTATALTDDTDATDDADTPTTNAPSARGESAAARRMIVFFMAAFSL